MTILYCKNVTALQHMRRLQMAQLLSLPLDTSLNSFEFDGVSTLTINELIVFRVLLCNLNHAVDRDRLMCAVYSDEGPWPDSNVLQVFVGRIRGKLGSQIEILPVRGVGYQMRLLVQ